MSLSWPDQPLLQSSHLCKLVSQFRSLIHCPFHVTMMQWFIKTSSIYWGVSVLNLKVRLRLLHSSDRWMVQSSQMAQFKWHGLLVQLSLSWPDRELRQSSKTRQVSTHPTPVFVLRYSNNALVNTCSHLPGPSFSLAYRQTAVHSNKLVKDKVVEVVVVQAVTKFCAKTCFFPKYHFLGSDRSNCNISFECLLVSGSV